ncbi:sugar phosphate isomerase/epimerase [Alphaproteobacteria bacterium]|nr:sugar phosphate isomerase/epimerase [Alphaproteobacteria bacterium]
MSGCFISSSCFPKTSISEALEQGGDLACKRVELSAPHHFEPSEEIHRLLRAYKRAGYEIQIHNYFPPPIEDFVLNIAASDNNDIQMAHALVHNALELSEVADCHIYGLHGGYLYPSGREKNGEFKFSGEKMSYEEALNNACRFVNEVSEKFAERKVRLLIENLFPSKDDNHSLFCSLDDIRDFFKLVPDQVGLLLDLGHLNITSNLWGIEREQLFNDVLLNFADRIYEVHLSENNGVHDQHKAVLDDSWQLNAIEILQSSVPNDLSFCLEARNAKQDEIKRSLRLINEIIA